MSFEIDVSDVERGLDEFNERLKSAIGLYGDTAGKMLEFEAKRKAKWIDRTGQSRKTIEGGHKWEGNKCHVYVSGNTKQFPYLELAMEKKYAILKPTLDSKSREVLEGLRNLLGD